MKILILNGSPHKQGTTAALTAEFQKGCSAGGHSIQTFDTAAASIHPCIGCNHCRTTEDVCVFKDDFEKLYPLLLDADLVVLVTPIYYFGMSAQLKSAIDRFFAHNTFLRSQSKKFALIAACGDQEEWAMDGLRAHYRSLCRYMHWDSAGELYAIGMYVPEDLKDSDYLERAYQFGASL